LCSTPFTSSTLIELMRRCTLSS
ncbi:hypothetical protein VCHENC02_2129B, partial [Vibrio harveyi]